jgi:HK97 family phage prohead protease
LLRRIGGRRLRFLSAPTNAANRASRIELYRRNPIWCLNHAHGRPIGTSVNIDKSLGVLKSTLELAVDILPDAILVQKMLVAGVWRACSIGFQPLKWSPMKDGDGIYFEESSLLEISVVSVPAAPGAICEGPVRALTGKALLRQRELELARLR